MGQDPRSTSAEEVAQTKVASGTDLRVKRNQMSTRFKVFLKREQACRRGSLTLPIAVRLPVQRKLARIVQHHELLQQALDDLTGGGDGADVELRHTIGWQVEGRSLVIGLTVRPSPALCCGLTAAFRLPGRSI